MDSLPAKDVTCLTDQCDDWELNPPPTESRQSTTSLGHFLVLVLDKKYFWAYTPSHIEAGESRRLIGWCMGGMPPPQPIRS